MLPLCGVIFGERGEGKDPTHHGGGLSAEAAIAGAAAVRRAARAHVTILTQGADLGAVLSVGTQLAGLLAPLAHVPGLTPVGALAGLWVAEGPVADLFALTAGHCTVAVVGVAADDLTADAPPTGSATFYAASI